LIGITGLEKRLLVWGSHHTGLPNPFDALDRLTGDPDELRRATEAWQATHADIMAVIDRLCVMMARLHEHRNGEPADPVLPLFATYLTELDALATDVKTTDETLHGLQFRIRSFGTACATAAGSGTCRQGNWRSATLMAVPATRRRRCLSM
jgi:hypothetical protein